MSLVKWVMVALVVVGLNGCATMGVINGGQNDAIDFAATADLAYEAEEWSTAEANYREVIQRVPSDAYAHFKLGNTLLKLDRWDEAIVAYRTALIADPAHAKAASNLASVHLIFAQQALHVAIENLKHTDPRAAMLVLREQRIHEIVEIPVDEKSATGRIISAY